jgi:hypothetical protein
MNCKLDYQSSQDKPQIRGFILCQKVKIICAKKRSYSNPSLNVLEKLIGIVKNRFLLNQDFIKIINRRISIK